MNSLPPSAGRVEEEFAPRVPQGLMGEAAGFAMRHLGEGEAGVAKMLEAVGAPSLAALLEDTVPAGIRLREELRLPRAAGEAEALAELRKLSERNVLKKSLIGQGYHGCFTPAVIQRNILENPAWYTAYTPYQAEIAQGRLEALAVFQTLVCDLTGLDIANASLLDEATAAAEAVTMAHAVWKKPGAPRLLVDASCHPQTLGVLRTRTEPVGVCMEECDALRAEFSSETFAVVVQLPDTSGTVRDFSELAQRAHAVGAVVIVAADPLALTLMEAPGAWGADIVVGSMQRFGVPLGYGGPHAAYLATRDKLKRVMPGRLVGLSHDVQGRPAYRLSLQTREQHIRRDKATSNICTAQVLLAVLSAMYAVYHGPGGLQAIAWRVHGLTRVLAAGLLRLGLPVQEGVYFDTLRVRLSERERDAWVARASAAGINLRVFADGIGIALDETVSLEDVATVLRTAVEGAEPDVEGLAAQVFHEPPLLSGRSGPFLEHPVFHRYRTETEMLRYIRALEGRDLSLVHSMIPLGSCTMKLNATSEMLPVTWPAFAGLHPFCPENQAQGYAQLVSQLGAWLAEVTGFAAVSLQPNAGSQGEYAGLLAIRAYHRARGEARRDVCLIPVSAHGTNPASAVMAGMRVVSVACRPDGDVDLEDLRAQAEAHSENLAALMVTYPSTHGVFEEGIRHMCELVHAHGGQVYLDGANMNAQVGLCRPADFGADVCHLNLHKTFCIPHGGGGPGVGPVGVAAHLAPYLPGTLTADHPGGVGPVSAAPQGSAGIFVIPWMYIRMMGAAGLRRATELAILNANYVAGRLDAYFPVLFQGRGGRVAHECILDLRGFKGTTAEDVAKRLMDYGFHSPTLSWPVPGTLMVEPTESESLAELERFCEAMIAIHGEMVAVEQGGAHPTDNVLKNAPHTAEAVCADVWTHPYTREQAAYPLPWLRGRKFWPPVSRIDNVWGDRNLFCACAPVQG